MQAAERCLYLFLASTLLTACGGGGDGGGTVTAPAAPAATITSTNAPTISAAVFNGTQTSADLDDFGSMFLLQGAAVSRNSGPGGLYLRFLESLSAKSKVIQPQVTLPPTDVSQELCLNFPNGTANVSGEVADPTGSITTGDRVSADFGNCDFGGGVVLSGGWDFVIGSFMPADLFENPLTSQFQMTLTITFRDLSVTESGETYSANGDVSTTIDTSDLQMSTVSVSGDRLTLTDGARVESLFDYTTSVSTEEATGNYVLSVSGTLESSLFSGSVAYSTPTPFRGMAFFDPDSGVLQIDGANGTSVTLTVLNNVDVQIDVHTDNDNVLDDTLFMSWDELRALL